MKPCAPAPSIRQPYAWLIVTAVKDVENRNWPTTYRGPILIHAAVTWGLRKGNWPWSDVPKPDRKKFKRDGIIGQADLIDCVTDHSSRWFQGPFGFVLVNARPRRFRPCIGHSYLFKPQ